MAAILVYVEQILGIIFTLLGIAQQTRNQTVGVAKERFTYEIAQNTHDTHLRVVNLTDEVAAIASALGDLSYQLTGTRADILAALDPVLLPPAPPSGWATPTAEAVWDYSAAITNGRTAITLLSKAGGHAENMTAHGVVPINGNPAFGYCGSWDSLYHTANVIFPAPNWADIRPDDTRLSWLQRSDLSGLTWQLGAGAEPVALANPSDELSSWLVVCLFSEAEFQSWLRTIRLDVAPVWPGADRVTLGTPVALERGLTITEPMDGVLIEVTSVDPKQMFYTYDDTRAYRHIGALAFVSDNGQVEGWQSLGFVSAVYCCRSLARAAAVKIMSANGTVGTATPWTRTDSEA